eukprot:SAG31_NODE_13888_length_839_cov_1.433784_1_plen_62_part_10
MQLLQKLENDLVKFQISQASQELPVVESNLPWQARRATAVAAAIGHNIETQINEQTEGQTDN